MDYLNVPDKLVYGKGLRIVPIAMIRFLKTKM